MPTPPNDVGAVPPLTEPPRIVNPNRRRDKPQLSCNLCRRRKLRCDRQHPCSCCTARGLACTYPEKSQASGPAAHLPKPAAMYDRIVQLERLVKSIVPDPKTGSLDSASDLASRFASLTGSAGAGIAPSISKLSIADPPKPLDVRSEYGSMRVSPSELRYVGGDHWAAILDNIADLKDHFDREEQDELAAPSDSQQGSDAVEGQLDDVVETDLDRLAVPQSTHALLLYGCPLPTSRSEILAALPPKSAVDRYISRYFGRLDIVHCHLPTSQYNAFWENPSGVSIIWIGLLFSMMCLAVVASDASDMAHGDPEHRSVQVAIYREKTVQCLLAGEYTKTGAYVLETIINYIYLELGVRGKDAGKDVWFLYALELNLAMRMGYHRDPIHYPDLTPLQAEMRRRLWATVLQGDILVSSQMGMPRMINDWKYDITEPRNLRDEDLNEEMTELPPVRPETELTPALGVIARRRMFVALGAVSDITATCQPCSYDEIMRVDKIFSEAIASIPEPLQPKPIAASMMDRAEVIMARMFLAHLSAKGQIMLHRRFLHVESPSSQEEDPYAYSRDVCLDAALRGLEIQHVLDEETRPGGQLYMMRWRVSSIMNSMFLTATMVLCSMLYRGPQTDQQQRQQIRRKEEILAALRRTRTIWMGAAARGSREGKKAAETVSFVLAKAG
ncbi:putative fungal-specific transcription factor, partial [Dichotomopilus funicola]